MSFPVSVAALELHVRIKVTVIARQGLVNRLVDIVQRAAGLDDVVIVHLALKLLGLPVELALHTADEGLRKGRSVVACRARHLHAAERRFMQVLARANLILKVADDALR